MGIQVTCDVCGGPDGDWGNHSWDIGLRFNSGWRPEGHGVMIHLCGKCGWKAARLLGFQYDTGTILSLARGEYITDASVCGPHGGGLGDIALHGVSHATHIGVEVQRPDAPLAGAMMVEKAK